eukprot:598072-Pyramimonas_sp.AAC.1
MGSSVDHMLHKQREAADAWESSPYGDMYGDGARHTARLECFDIPKWSHPIRIVPQPRGALTSLQVQTHQNGRALYSKSVALLVTIDVHAVGLNFRDVLN